MLPENRVFFVRGDDGREYGPVGLEELREWVQENRAGVGTEVRMDEPRALWQPWQYYPELVALAAEVQATDSAPGPAGLTPAGLGRRAVAFGLDMVLIFILFVPVFTVVAFAYMPDFLVKSALASLQPQLPSPDMPLYVKVVTNLIFNLILALYMTGFQAAHGQTPAKSVLRVRVVDQAGRRPGVARAFLRALALIFSMNLLFIPFIYAFLNPERRAFHDFVAGTYVVES